jgi:hypothetical protein
LEFVLTCISGVLIDSLELPLDLSADTTSIVKEESQNKDLAPLEVNTQEEPHNREELRPVDLIEPGPVSPVPQNTEELDKVNVKDLAPVRMKEQAKARGTFF